MKKGTRANRTEQSAAALWDAVARLLSAAGVEGAAQAQRQVRGLRGFLGSDAPTALLKTLRAHGPETPAKRDTVLAAAQDLVHACAPEQRAMEDLDHVLTVYALALIHDDLLPRVTAAMGDTSAGQVKGATPMDQQAHVNALQGAELDETAFAAALDALFRDEALDAKERQRVAAAITKAPARRLSSDQARRDELQRWFYAKLERAGRAERRAMETSRF